MPRSDVVWHLRIFVQLGANAMSYELAYDAEAVLFHHSLGIYYAAFTQWLGFPEYGDEGKVMGLAPYGDPDPYLKAAMMVLPEQFRIAVYFADVAGYSYKEIAAMTDTRQGTISSRLNRGRKQLRDLLFDSPINHAARTIDKAPSGATQKRAIVNGAELNGGHPAADDH